MSFFLSILLTASLVSARDIVRGRDALNSASSSLTKPASSSSTSIRSSFSSTSSSTSQDNIGAFIAAGLGVSTEASSSSSTAISSLSTIVSSSSAIIEHVSNSTVQSSSALSSTTHSTLTVSQTQTQTRVSSAIGTGSSASISGTSSGSQMSVSGNVTAFTTPTVSFTWHIPGTGSVTSCQNALWTWYSESSIAAVSSNLYSVTTKTTVWTVSGVPQVSTIINRAGVTSRTTLCDGYARQIGPTPSQKTTTSVTSSSNEYTILGSIPNYPTTPCSIAPTDCTSLWSSYLNPTTTLSVPQFGYPPPPPCPTGNATTFDFQANEQIGEYIRILAQEAQLFYWPVQLADPAALHANSSQNPFCHEQYDGWIDPGLNTTLPTHALARTLPGTRTGAGPNTAVVSGITITSPTVAIAFSRLEPEAPGIVVDTVITMAPDQVMTYRGAGGAAIALPMEYEQLNWVCRDKSKPNATYTTQNSQGENCYQNVEADAYFNSPEKFFAFQSWLKSSKRPQITIANDYAPQVAPAAVVSSVIQSIWGPGATWDARGVWDPPSALSNDDNVIAPTVAAPTTTSVQALSDVTTSAQIQQTATPPAPVTISIPALTTSTQVQPSTQTTTELPPPPSPTIESVSTDSPSPNNQQNNSPSNQGNSQTNDSGSSKADDPGPSPSTQQPATPATQQPGTPATQQPADPSTQQPVASAQTQGSNPSGGTVNVDGQTSQQAVAAQPTVISIGSTAVTAVNSGSDIVVGSATLAPGDATTIAGQQVSNPSQGSTAIVVGTGDSASTVAVPAPASSASLSISSVSSGVVAVNGQTLTAGGSAQTIDGQQVSLGSAGVVVSSANTPTTIAIDVPSQVTVGSSVISISSLSSGVAVVGTQTLTAGGSAQTIDGQQVSLGSAGIVVSSANTPTTIPLDVPSQVTIGSSVVSISSLSSGVAVVGTQTLSVGGQPGSLNGQQISVASDGLIIGTGSTAQTIPLFTASVVTIGSQTFTRSVASGGVEILSNGQTAITLTPGSSDATIGGQVVSAATGGLVVPSGAAQTIPLTAASVITIGSQTFTRSVASGGVEVLSNGQTAITLTPGSSGATIAGQVVSAATGGLVVSSNGKATTLSISPGSAASRLSGVTSGTAAPSKDSAPPGSGSPRGLEVGGSALAITLLSFFVALRYAV